MNDANIIDYMKSDILYDTVDEAVAVAAGARAQGKIAFVMPYEGYAGRIHYTVHEMTVERNMEIVRDLVKEWLGD